MEKLGRRDFLKFVVKVPVAIILVAACTPPVRDNRERQTPSDGKARMIKEISELPDSAVKTLLTQKALPYFQQTPPFTLHRSGLEIRVLGVTVRREISSTIGLGGTLNYRGDASPASPKPIVGSEVKFPLLGIVMENEKHRIHPEDWTTDGLPFVRLNFHQQTALPGGIRPEIIISVPESRRLTPSMQTTYNLIEKFAYVKEACTLILHDIQVEETFRKMAELGIQTHLPVRDSRGQIIQEEIVTTGLNELAAQHGRLAAVIDIAGYVMALKAMEETNVVAVLRTDPNIKPTIDMLGTIDLGTTPQDAFYRSVRFATTTPVAELLPHTGDLKKLP